MSRALRRPSERLPEWVPLLLEPEDRKMLEDLTRLKGTDASRVVRALILREHKNLRFMLDGQCGKVES